MSGDEIEVLRRPSRFQPNSVHRRGEVLVRSSGPWTPAVHALLRHLEAVGFDGSPRLVGSGLDAEGRETLTFIPGEFTQPGPWSLEGAAGVGRLLRELHDATASFVPPAGAVWKPSQARDLGGPRRVISHCNAAPWNIVARNGLPVALIDWEDAGPIDPLVELAEVCWLNAKLHDDYVAEREGLPPLDERARQLRAMVDAYGLTRVKRRGFVARIVEVAISAVVGEADLAGIRLTRRWTISTRRCPGRWRGARGRRFGSSATNRHLSRRWHDRRDTGLLCNPMGRTPRKREVHSTKSAAHRGPPRQPQYAARAPLLRTLPAVVCWPRGSAIANRCAEQVIAALRYFRRRLGRPLVVVWDRLPAHRTTLVLAFVAAHPDDYAIEWLPSYAPDLNPEELCNGAVKRDLLNAAPVSVDELHRLARRGFRRLAHRPELLRGFFRHIGLSVA